MRLTQIAPVQDGQRCVVDILAIHGAFEDDVATWTEPKAQVLWLRDILPEELPAARILTYGYDTSRWTLSSRDVADKISDQSDNLLADLLADRELCGAVERPLIFICHGLGGIIVKRALASSSRSSSRHSRTRRSIYVSTYAIIFMAVPHQGFNSQLRPMSLTRFSKLSRVSSEQFASALSNESEILQDIEDQFTPLAKRFLIYCFWEQRRSLVDGADLYIVEKDSAVPEWLDVEKAGLDANHSEMCKFKSRGDDGFRIILAALRRYIDKATLTIETRWIEDRRFLRQEDEAEAAEVLQADIQLLRAPFPVPKLTNLHFKTPRLARKMFTGRSDVARILQANFFSTAVRSDPHRHKIFVLHGLGGAGKTEFCLKFAQDNRDRYWGVFWVDASTDENAQASFAALGDRIKIGNAFEAGKFWLADQHQPWLLVIDNADDPSLDLSAYIPAGNSGHILVTTRNPNNVSFATAGHKEFRDMEPDDAASLLLKAADPEGKESNFNTQRRTIALSIAKALGYLALALVHAGATIHRKICKLEEYLSEYMKNRKEIMNLGASVSDPSSSVPIIATWEISYKRISNVPAVEAKDAMDILCVFAFLHFEHIPECLFKKAWGDRQTRDVADYHDISFTQRIQSIFRRPVEQVDVAWPDILNQKGRRWNRSRFRKALALLSDYSLIYHDPNKSMCYMHPIIHAWARDRMSPEAQNQWLNATAAILSGSITTTMEASGREYRRLLSPHIDACLGAGNIQIDDHLDQGARSLKFASVYAECGRWKSAARIQRHVIEVRRRTCGMRHFATLDALYELGQTCWNLFNPREALKIQIEILQAQDRGLLWPGGQKAVYFKTLDDLGRTHWLLGNRREAENLGSRAVLGLTDRLGEQDPATLCAMHNLACTYIHLSQPQRAVELLERVLATRLELWGFAYDPTLATMNELSMAYLALGSHRFQEAEKLCRQALNGRIAILGEEHAYTLWSVNNLSKICCATGRYEEAARMIEKIIPIVIRTLGEAHVGMTMTKYNLACAYAGQTKWSKAEEVLRTQLDYISPYHPDWISYMSQLARVCDRGGHQLEAQEICVRVVKHYGIDRSLNSKTPEVQRVVEKLYHICIRRGQIDDRSQFALFLTSTDFGLLTQPTLGTERPEQRQEARAIPPSEDEEFPGKHAKRPIHTSRTW